ncbi:uncharacterized protein LOC129618880 [Condylostylus longicornis]|uniref:uncharacterized protein LOC129618880 n=1 Tax=Condylostylus longicornis TaxID=2530218 RepID=UPI00244DB109|nr:uncharacterized protein LOC129618880 [Condylostylus longicornis]
MQAIIKNLKNLKKLKIDTFKGSDYGFTGIDSETGKQNGVPIWNLTKLENLKLFYTKAFNHQTIMNFFKFTQLKTFLFENIKIRWKCALPVDYILQIINNCPELETLRFSYNEEVSLQSIRKLKEIYDPQNRIISRDFKNCCDN